MTVQLNLFRKENNPESERILRSNEKLFSKQCTQLLELFNQGKVLTVRDGMNLGIGDLRRRVKDLRDSGIEIKDELIEGRYKKYFL